MRTNFRMQVQVLVPVQMWSKTTAAAAASFFPYSVSRTFGVWVLQK